jgi:hypothetical protein
MSDIDALINILNYVDSNECIELKNHCLVEAISFLATECFVSDDGYLNRMKLKNAGYRLSPAEMDSFGWLTGWIHLKRGDILFG